jgi:hypothetical protein
MGKMPEFQIAPVLQTNEYFRVISSLNASEKVGNKFASKKLPAMDTKPPPPLPPILEWERCREFQIATVLQTMNISTRFLH